MGEIARFMLLLLALLLIAAPLQADEANSPGDTVLVLRNKRVLRGDVTRLGERCIVVLNNGAQVQLNVQDIALEANSLEEAYVLLRDSMPAPQQVNSHLELARWCLREGLAQQAAAELAAAKAINPMDPEMARLERQIAHASQPKNTSKPADTSDNSERPKPKPVDPKQLEEMLRSMPKEAVEEFTSSVQPLLLNGCGTSRCHDGKSATSFRLLRPLNGERFWRGMTLRNLQATRAQINVNDLAASPLLVKGTAAHGGRDKPVFEDDDQRLHVLVNWVRHTSRSITVRESAATIQNEPGKFQPDNDARPLNEPLPMDTGGEAIVAGEQDPFDPAEFNERYLNPGRPAAGQ